MCLGTTPAPPPAPPPPPQSPVNPTPAQVRSQTAGLYGSQNNTILTGSQGDNSAVAGKLGRQTLLGQ